MAYTDSPVDPFEWLDEFGDGDPTDTITAMVNSIGQFPAATF